MSLSFVYVFLGKKVPNYFWKNMSRNALLFRDSRHVFVSDQVHKQADKFSVEQVKISRPPKLTHHGWDESFRGGFWSKTLDRIRVLPAIHHSLGDVKMVHVEGDVLLFKNFPVDEVSRGTKIAWTPLSEDKDVPAVMYFPRVGDSQLFGELVENQLAKPGSWTDMAVLREVAKVLGIRHEYLPVWDDRLPGAMKVPQRMRSNERFKVVFDSATLGMWLTGHDPRNNRGKNVLHRTPSDHIIQPGSVDYSLGEDGQLQILSSKAQIEVCCLHIHSKNVELFKEDSQQELLKFVELSKVPGEVEFGSPLQQGLWRVKALAEFVRSASYYLSKRIKNLLITR